MVRFLVICVALTLLFPLSQAWAGESPQEQRHELMEGVKDAAKPVGAMLKGEKPFDDLVVVKSFATWQEAARTFGNLFPEGSETGYDTQARDTIWSDRKGFDQELADFSTAVDRAIMMAPRDVEALKASAGPVFKVCKSCHESYRVEKED